MGRRDYRSSQVRRMVVIGASNAEGRGATDPRNAWVQTLANMIRDFQDGPLEVINNAIGADVIGPNSPGYSKRYYFGSGILPSALERFEKDLIAPEPDLAITSYGLNDARCGNPVKSFLSDLTQILATTCEKTDALVVLTGPYWNTQFDEVLWNALPVRPDFGAFSKTGKDLVCSYIEGMRALAEKFGCLFVDLFAPTEGSTWLLTDDQCHFNDVGHRILGSLVFQAIATNCSFIGKKSKCLSQAFDIQKTGRHVVYM